MEEFKVGDIVLYKLDQSRMIVTGFERPTPSDPMTFIKPKKEWPEDKSRVICQWKDDRGIHDDTFAATSLIKEQPGGKDKSPGIYLG